MMGAAISHKPVRYKAINLNLWVEEIHENHYVIIGQVVSADISLKCRDFFPKISLAVWNYTTMNDKTMF